MPPLTRLVLWSQQLIAEVLAPGELAVDLTAGRGRDTLALAQGVGPQGQVVAFDVQAEALEQTARLLAGHGYEVFRWSAGRVIPGEPGLFLVHSCHANMNGLLGRRPKAVTANLGYLPGSDRSLVTRPETTRRALQQSLDLLKSGGRLAVTVYPGHAGGTAEAALVEDMFCQLSPDVWQVLLLRVANRPESPFLLVAERKA